MKCLSKYELEKYFVEEAERHRAFEIDRHLQECARCQDYVLKLKAQRLRFLAERPAYRFVSTLTPGPTKRGFRLESLLAPALAGAVATCLVIASILLFRSGDGDGPRPIRLKGGLSVSVHRKTAGGSELVSSASRFHPKDQLQFVLHLKARSAVAIIALRATGKTSVFVPKGGKRTPLLGPGDVTLPDSVVLDDSLSHEKLFFIACKKPFNVAPSQRALSRKLAQDTRSGTPFKDLSYEQAGCETTSLLLRKHPRK